MLVAAMCCAIAAFVLFIIAIQSSTDVYTWLLVVVALVGIVLFCADLISKHKAGSSSRDAAADHDAGDEAPTKDTSL